MLTILLNKTKTAYKILCPGNLEGNRFKKHINKRQKYIFPSKTKGQSKIQSHPVQLDKRKKIIYTLEKIKRNVK